MFVLRCQDNPKIIFVLVKKLSELEHAPYNIAQLSSRRNSTLLIRLPSTVSNRLNSRHFGKNFQLPVGADFKEFTDYVSRSYNRAIINPYPRNNIYHLPNIFVRFIRPLHPRFYSKYWGILGNAVTVQRYKMQFMMFDPWQNIHNRSLSPLLDTFNFPKHLTKRYRQSILILRLRKISRVKLRFLKERW